MREPTIYEQVGLLADLCCIATSFMTALMCVIMLL